MFLMLWESYIVGLVAAPICVYIGIDPLHVLFSTKPHNYSFLLTLFRIGLFGLVAADVMKSVTAFFLLRLMVVCSINDIINDLRRLTGTKGMLLGNKEIYLFRKMYVWNKYTNSTFSAFAVPPSIFFGISVVILTYFGSIRLSGKMMFLAYLLNPIGGFLATCFVVVFIPQAAKMFEYSTSFLREMRNAPNLLKMQRKGWKSLRPLNIQVGQFGVVSRKLTPILIKFAVETTVTLLLTFWVFFVQKINSYEFNIKQ